MKPDIQEILKNIEPDMTYEDCAHTITLMALNRISYQQTDNNICKIPPEKELRALVKAAASMSVCQALMTEEEK